MLKKNNRKERIIFIIVTTILVLISFNYFLVKEVKYESDLVYKKIKLAKLYKKHLAKGNGYSVTIIDYNGARYKILRKHIKCCDIKTVTKLKKGDSLTIGFVKNDDITSYFNNSHEILWMSSQTKQYINFQCIVSDYKFGKWKILWSFIILDIILAYFLFIVKPKKLYSSNDYFR